MTSQQLKSSTFVHFIGLPFFTWTKRDLYFLNAWKKILPKFWAIFSFCYIIFRWIWYEIVAGKQMQKAIIKYQEMHSLIWQKTIKTCRLARTWTNMNTQKSKTVHSTDITRRLIDTRRQVTLIISTILQSSIVYEVPYTNLSKNLTRPEFS